MGMVYLPIYDIFLPEPYASELKKQYLDKKMTWVEQEQRGTTDVLYEIKQKSAENFVKDTKFLGLKGRPLKEAYIGLKLGSEWTKTEISEIYQITKLLQQGVIE
jgi:hypothetical protein